MAALNQAAIQEKAELRILRRKQVEARIGLSRSTIYSKLTHNPKRPGDYDPTFPKPVTLGGGKAIGWVEGEVNAWIVSQVEKSRKA